MDMPFPYILITISLVSLMQKLLITYLATRKNPWHGKLKQFYLDY
jgi:hypothetical protein